MVSIVFLGGKLEVLGETNIMMVCDAHSLYLSVPTLPHKRSCKFQTILMSYRLASRPPGISWRVNLKIRFEEMRASVHDGPTALSLTHGSRQRGDSESFPSRKLRSQAQFALGFWFP